MGLNFGKTESAVAEKTDQTVVTQTAELAPAPQFDIVADSNSTRNQLVGTEEVERLTQLVNVNDSNTIVTFGADVANEVAKTADVVLNNMNMQQLNEASTLMTELAKIMSQFDIDEIKDDPKGLAKLFSNAKKKLEQILAKYDTMGKHVDKIFIELKKYEDEINRSNKNLNDMFNANINFYHELIKYIVAGEQLDRELDEYIANLNAQFTTTGDNSLQFQIQAMQQAQQLLQQRVQDLRTAENVALQSIPMLKMMETSNLNLIRKIDSAFIITLPVFKQALAQAIMLKRQKIQAESMAALDAKTNELLLKNAQNTVEMSKRTAELASGSSIKIETLEQSWRTIVDGIEATKQIEADATKKREEDKVRLDAIKADFKSKFGSVN